MSPANAGQPERIRLVFELERADNPRLYEDLIQCKKGSKRVNRLRTLAHEGLLAQIWSARGGAAIEDTNGDRVRVDVGGASVTNQVFDQPLME
jgi:hypothetical protein